MKAESSTTHSGRSEPVSSNFSRRELSPDTESESEWQAQVELNQMLPSASSSSRNGPAEATQLAEPTNKRKKANPKSGGRGNPGIVRSYEYRQPVCRVIPNIKSNEEWAEATAKLQDIVTDPEKSAAVVHTKRLHLNQLIDHSGSWGVVDKHNAGEEGGPCSNCVKRKGDCIVKLETMDDKWPSGAARHKIVSRCMRCIITGGPRCDIVLQRESKKESASDQSDLRIASTDLELVDELDEDEDDVPFIPPIKAKPNRAANIPTSSSAIAEAPPPKPRKSETGSLNPQPTGPKKGRASQAISDSSETLNSSPTHLIPPTIPTSTYSEADRARLATAISDISEFHASIREMFVERNEMDFRTRSMLRLVEESIDIVKQFTEDHR